MPLQIRCVFARDLLLAQKTLRLVFYLNVIKVAPDVHAPFATAEHDSGARSMQPSVIPERSEYVTELERTGSN